ncbi:hypothetical protein [Halococcus salifodinae]|uniref:Uncharacterized protein n=1 Tax=Halococcus salifodinae DSM 8989 TaxID=1227456 RepID=M0N8S1_9EURY|nr:hypothetical protein [Halococcus salifodinae]EMA54367.1 hypothetical protein C450_06040 [Halococcus salifodinae DSM 8989]
MSKHSDIGIQSRWFTIDLTICQFRESYWPAAYSGSSSVDLFVPLPGNRTLWAAASSRWLAEQLGIDPFSSEALASVVPDPPHNCKAEGCEFETEDYSVFLTHDEREHAPEANHHAEQEGR